MNRRQFNGTAVASAAALWLPSWLLPQKRVRHLDLSPFCDTEQWSRYALDTPFHQEGMT